MAYDSFLILTTVVLITMILFWINCGGGAGDVAATIKILLQDGTEKELSSTPIPKFLKIQITFFEAVDPTMAESLFTLKDGDKTVETTISWNEANTVMTVKPNDLLDYQTIYTIGIASGQVVADVSAFNGITKTNVAASSTTFKTMLESDVNGDGDLDIIAKAPRYSSN
ncbi:MAG: Ig-like domain-containing protein [Pseudomonadota bacterium]